MTVTKVRTVAAAAALVAIATPAAVTGSADASVQRTEGMSLAVGRPHGIPPILYRFRLKQIPSYFKFNPTVIRIRREEGVSVLRTALNRYNRSEGGTCLRPIAVSFCRPEPQGMVTGVSLIWNGKWPGVWSSPSSPRTLLHGLGPGYLQKTTCYRYGDRASDGVIATRLWYRLEGGGYVNDGFLETGTNAPVPGSRPC
jgi:hypothetical protein